MRRRPRLGRGIPGTQHPSQLLPDGAIERRVVHLVGPPSPSSSLAAATALVLVLVVKVVTKTEENHIIGHIHTHTANAATGLSLLSLIVLRFTFTLCLTHGHLLAFRVAQRRRSQVHSWGGHRVFIVVVVGGWQRSQSSKT